MGAIAQVQLSDGETVPVIHTFGPDRIDQNGVAHYENRVTGIVQKYETLALSNLKPKLVTGVRKVRVRLDLPYFDTVDTMLKLGSVGFDGTFLLPNNSLKQARKNLRYMLADLFGEAAFAAITDDGESIY